MGGEAQAVIFDLEFTAWEGSRARGWSGPNEHREVIQIGAVRVEAASGRTLAGLDLLVRPRINPVLSSFITNLTGIANEDLARHGMSFEEAYGRFLAFLGPAPLFCYGWDHEVIAENLALYGLVGRFPVPHAANLHGFFRDAGLPIDHLSSGGLAGHLGLPSPTQTRSHNALHDCLSQASAAAHLIARGRTSPFLAPPAP